MSKTYKVTLTHIKEYFFEEIEAKNEEEAEEKVQEYIEEDDPEFLVNFLVSDRRDLVEIEENKDEKD